MKRLLYPILITLLFVGCKPTEKGYQAAYDAAKNKREAAAGEQMLPAQGLQSDDGPQLRVVDGDSIYVLRAIMRTEDSKRAPAPWLLTVEESGGRGSIPNVNQCQGQRPATAAGRLSPCRLAERT